MVDRPVEETLDLGRVQIHGHQPVRARGQEQVRHQPGGDRLAAPALLVLAGVAEERRHDRDPLGRGPLERVDHDQMFHDPLIDRRGVALQYERVAPSDRLEEPNEDLAVGEVEQGGGGRLDAEVVADLLAKLGESAAAEEHHPLVGYPGAASHQTLLSMYCRYYLRLTSMSRLTRASWARSFTPWTSSVSGHSMVTTG